MEEIECRYFWEPNWIEKTIADARKKIEEDNKIIENFIWGHRPRMIVDPPRIVIPRFGAHNT